jgi:hypothetical protein
MFDNLFSWEVIHFQQMPSMVKLNLATLKSQVKDYEKMILDQWKLKPL